MDTEWEIVEEPRLSLEAPRPEPEPVVVEVYNTRLSCPKCGWVLYSNGPLAWCSHIARPGQPGCDFGIAEKVTMDHFRGSYL